MSTFGTPRRVATARNSASVAVSTSTPAARESVGAHSIRGNGGCNTGTFSPTPGALRTLSAAAMNNVSTRSIIPS